jgi:hypothetical protein
MLKRVVLLAGAFGTIMTLAAVGCSGSSNDLVSGGDSGSGDDDNDATTSFTDSGKRIDSGPVVTDGGTKDSGSVSVTHDGGGTLVNDSGIVVQTDSGTSPIQTIDAGSAVIDSGTVVEPDGGTTGSCFVNSAAQQLDVSAPVAGQNRCTPTQISTFNTACLGATATTAACNALVAADGDCADCLFGGNPDGGVGTAPALLPVGGGEQVNFNGCIAAISTAPSDCKLQYQEITFCAATTCSTCTTDTSSSSCLDFSETDPSAACATDFPLTSECDTEVEGSVSALDANSKCAEDAVDFTTAYTAIATTICGAP